jgi:hypothetical protein
LTEEKLESELVVAQGAESLVERVAAGIPDSYRAALVLTDRPHECLCLANRRPTLRAALGLDASMAGCALRQIRANVLVTSGTEIGEEVWDEFVRYVCE